MDCYAVALFSGASVVVDSSIMTETGSCSQSWQNLNSKYSHFCADATQQIKYSIGLLMTLIGVFLNRKMEFMMFQSVGIMFI